MIQPIFSLLKSRQNDLEWNPALRGGQAGRQWPQSRVYTAGWSEHNKCLACLQALVEERETSCQRQARIELLEGRGSGAPVQVLATAAQIEAAPIGDLFHRSWTCKLLEPERLKHASGSDRARTKEGWGRGKVAWERALVPLPPPPPRPPAAEATFHWKVKPSDDFVSGPFYLDRLSMDPPLSSCDADDLPFQSTMMARYLRQRLWLPFQGLLTLVGLMRGRYCKLLFLFSRGLQVGFGLQSHG